VVPEVLGVDEVDRADRVVGGRPSRRHKYEGTIYLPVPILNRLFPATNTSLYTK
jgi:hypothetical protein